MWREEVDIDGRLDCLALAWGKDVVAVTLLELSSVFGPNTVNFRSVPLTIVAMVVFGCRVETTEVLQRSIM